MIRLATADRFSAYVGQELGVTGWYPVTQRSVDLFAELTGDHQWIHVDPEKAATGPYRGTIAHGLLVASLVPAMISEVVRVDGGGMVLNKGLDRLRFAAPVRVGDRIRGRVALGSARSRPRNFWESVFQVGVEVEGASQSAFTVRVTFLYQGA